MINGISTNERMYFLIDKNKIIKKAKKEFIEKNNTYNKVKLLLYRGNYVDLDLSDNKILKNKNFLNSQNYLTSNNKNYKLYYFSQEKRNRTFKNGKILIGKIKIDLLENINIKALAYLKINNKVNKYKVYVGTKFLYLKDI